MEVTSSPVIGRTLTRTKYNSRDLPICYPTVAGQSRNGPPLSGRDFEWTSRDYLSKPTDPCVYNLDHSMSRLLTLTGGRASVLNRYPSLRLVGGARFASTAPANDDKKKYSATLLLPKTPMQLRAKSPLKIEDRLRDRTTHELYREQVGCLQVATG